MIFQDPIASLDPRMTVGDIVGGKGHAPQQVDDGDKGHIAAAGKARIAEHQHRQHTGGQHTEQNPRLELAPTGLGPVSNYSHHRIGNGIPDTCYKHQHAGIRKAQSENI